MGRQVRRVPATWDHPRTAQGGYIPLYHHFPYSQTEVEEGLRDGWLTETPPFYGCDVMPQWPEAERTHYQMYEDTTEGTPISPVCATPEALAQWLAEHDVSFFGAMTSTYGQWLAIIRGQRVGLPFFVMRNEA